MKTLSLSLLLLALFVGTADAAVAEAAQSKPSVCRTHACDLRVIKKRKIHRIYHFCNTWKCVKRVSKIRKHRARKRERAMYKRCSTNVLTCIALAARKYGVSYDWLVACARSESGLSPRAYNRSGASGLFQFKPTTFSATIARMGLSPKSIWDPYWNAMAAAWKFHFDGTGEWTGAGC